MVVGRIGKTLGSDRKDLWAIITTIACTVTLNALFGITIDTATDSVAQILLGTIPVNLWWVIFAGKAAVISLVIVINMLYWIERDLVDIESCPSMVLVTVPWATFSFLMTQFAQNSLFASLNIVFMSTLGLFILISLLTDIDFDTRTANVSIFTAVSTTLLLAFLHLMNIKNPLTLTLIPAFGGLLGDAWRTLLFSIPLVLSINVLTNETIKRTVLETRLEDVYQEYDIFPENDSLRVIFLSTILGVLINLYFTTIYIGEPLMVIPGLTWQELITIIPLF